jgi:ATP-binding cassette, subfamily B, bacterial
MMLFALLDWPMTMTLAVLVVMITGSLIWFGERGRQVHAAYARTANIAAGSLIDVIANMWVVKAFSAAGHEHRRLGELFGREASAQRESWMYTERARIFHDVALCILAGLMLSWCIKLWGEGRITPGDVVLVSALTFRILHGSRDFALAFIEMGQQLGFIQETLNVIAQKPGIIDLPGALSPRRAEGSIEFNEVSFRYETGRDAVHELSLKVPAGQKLGVVGPSGAGKSTLLHLVQRLSDPQAGAVLVGGLPVHRVTQDSLRQLLAVVPQEITLFHRSVLENIRIARPAASDEEVQQAASAAQCDVFVRNLPLGYSTIVGERGMKLSGGQRQRVALARAFLKDAPIIILDEATSALDTESELKVHDALLRRFQDRTVLAVAHRLSTLIAFDRVVVMDAGRVVEEGKPVDLLGGGGMFEQMWQLQMNGFRTLKAAAGSQGRSCGSTPDANASMNCR